MKIFDLLKIAAKDIKSFWTVLIAFGMAAAAFCLCFAGAVLVSVSQEQSMPYELSVSGGAELKAADIVKISAVPDVNAATLVIQVPATIKTGEYSAELVLTGIDSAYIHGKFAQGGIFSDGGVMPYIILNSAACKAFVKPGSFPPEYEAQEDAADINWLSTGYNIQAGGDNSNSIAGKVCGILAGSENEDQPKGYISIATAKELLKAEGQDTGTFTADVRIRNIGCAAAVSQAIENIGYQVSNPNEDLQKKWGREFGEMAYLIVTGASLLLLTAFISAAWRKISIFRQNKAYVMLCWMGMKEKGIRRLFVIQSLILSLLGITVGTIIALTLPSFLSQDLKGISVYMLPIPFGSAAASSATCVLIGLLSLFKLGGIIDFNYS